MLFRKLWPSLVWALIILVLTGFPGDYFPEVLSFWEWLGPDKLVHVFIFGTLSFLLVYNLREHYFRTKKRYLFIITIISVTLAYGLLTEVLQETVFIGRDGNAYDFMANGLGVFTGWFAFFLIYRKK